MSPTLPSGVKRTNVPFLLPDLVTISDPTIMRQLASSPDLTRAAEGQLPPVMSAFFLSTKYYSPVDEQFVTSLLGNEQQHRPQRRQDVQKQLARGLREDQIASLVALAKGNEKDFRKIEVACTKIVADLILPIPAGEELPDDIANASWSTLKKPAEMVNPFNYFRARAGREKLENYVRGLLPNEEHICDFAQNLGAAGNGFAKAIVSMRDMREPDVRTHFCANPIVESVIRVPNTTTTLGGLFPEDKPLLPNKTVIVFAIAEAATQSIDDKFLFGAGIKTRECPFKGLFFSTVTKMHADM